MVWIVLTASIGTLGNRLGALILIHKVEIHVMDHCLLFAHVAGARRLD